LFTVTNKQQVNGTTNKIVPKDNTTIAFDNATEALKNATRSIQSIQNNIDPCARITSAVPSTVAIDSRKVLIVPQDAVLNVLVYDENDCLINEQVNIEVRYLGKDEQADKNLESIASRTNKSKPAVVTEASASNSQQTDATINKMPPLIYNQTAVNTFFSKSGVPLDKPGVYLVQASIPGQEQAKISLTLIDGLNFFGTRFFVSIIIGVSALIALLIISGLSNRFDIIEKYSKEVRFLCISIIVFSIVVALYFVSEELGVGAPVGLVKRPLINSTSITDIIPGSSGEQWMINIGGVRENNYKFGLQIPIYVFVFGILGGYIRYLYATTQPQTDVRTVRLLRIRLFSWNNVPGQDADILRDFLKKKYELKWINDKLNFKKDNKKLLLKDDNNVNLLSITLDDDTATLYLNDKEEKDKFIVKKENTDSIVYAEQYDPLKSTFYTSLRDIALILLAPLLAAAVWFLVIQNGVDPIKGIFVLAVVSFAVGLATNNVVDALVNFLNIRMRATQTSTSIAATRTQAE